MGYFTSAMRVLERRNALNTAVADEVFRRVTTTFKDVDIAKHFFRTAAQQVFNDVWGARAQFPPLKTGPPLPPLLHSDIPPDADPSASSAPTEETYFIPAPPF